MSYCHPHHTINQLTHYEQTTNYSLSNQKRALHNLKIYPSLGKFTSLYALQSCITKNHNHIDDENNCEEEGDQTVHELRTSWLAAWRTAFNRGWSALTTMLMFGRKSASYCTHNAATAAICTRMQCISQYSNIYIYLILQLDKLAREIKHVINN